MATTEMIVAITLIVVGVFYIIERLMYLAAWYYGKTVERNDNVDTPEPGEEIQGLN